MVFRAEHTEGVEVRSMELRAWPVRRWAPRDDGRARPWR